MQTDATESPRYAAQTQHASHGGRRLERWIPALAVSPAFAVSLCFFYGLTLWVACVSFTDSDGLLHLSFAGFDQYRQLWGDPNWSTALWNLLLYVPVAVAVPMALGCLLAILLDQRVGLEGAFRTIYLYPLSLSWIVSGTIWRWLLSPETGIETWLHRLGFTHAQFDWIVQPRRAIFALAVVAVWHSTGFVTAIFIAGLRAVDDSLIKAALIDGASMPRIYWRIVLPLLRPTVLSAALILLPAVFKTFDLIVVMTQGGPGQSTVLPAFYMFDRFFRREQMGLGAASASIILMMCVAIAVPYILNEMRKLRHE